MDFSLSTSSGNTDIAYNGTTDLSTNVWLSWNVPKGAFFMDTSFGHRFRTIRVVNDESVLRLRDLGKEALSWMIRVGRATSIEVLSERDDEYPDRINLRAIVTDNEGRKQEFAQFYEVV